MSLGGILLVALVQLAALLIPLAIGLSGLISGSVAGLTSVLAWAVVGVPTSYAVVDVWQTFRASARSRYAAARAGPIHRFVRLS